jgi:hypothetical protein
MHPALSALFLAAIAFLAPTSAFGQSCKAPPGRAGLEQYCETVPGPGGDQGPGDFGRGGGSGLAPTTRKELNANGVTGRALLGFAEGTGRSGDSGGATGDSNTPAADADRDPRSTGSPRSRGDRQGSEPSNNPLRAVRAAAESGSSVGPVFLWALLALALVVGALGWVRYRRGGAGLDD